MSPLKSIFVWFLLVSAIGLFVVLFFWWSLRWPEDEVRFMNVVEAKALSFRTPTVRTKYASANFEPFSGCDCALSFSERKPDWGRRSNQANILSGDQSITLEYDHFTTQSLFVATIALPNTAKDASVLCGGADSMDVRRILQFLADCVALYGNVQGGGT